MSDRSIFNRIQRFLPYVAKPARYVGNEINMVKKDLSRVSMRMALCYPDAYEVGMSNLGVQILYEAVNRVDGLYCERVFTPWVDFEEVLRENEIPLYSLETFTPLNEFDVLGFSIGYELLYTNMLSVLELGHIPLFSKQRSEDDPFVIAGGPSIYNPEPAADFIDVFILGDGERALLEFLQTLLSLKGMHREKKLEALNRFDFTYIPSLYTVTSRGRYVYTNVDKSIFRRIEPDLDSLPISNTPIVPLIKVVQDRVSIEVNRGCTNGCRFCQAGYTYRPVRERSVSNIVSILTNALSRTGYEEVSLVSLSIGDYTQLEELVDVVHREFSSAHVSISLPSLRVNSAGLSILERIGAVRKSGLTFAIESADEEVRKCINKPVDEYALRGILHRVMEAGWRLIKLYFMVGLPGAVDEAEAIGEFIERLRSNFPKLSINANVSVFIPKPHTPLEYTPQMDLEESRVLLSNLRKRFGDSRVSIKFQNPLMSYVEGVLSRGDRAVGRSIYEVYRMGERFSSWDEMFAFNLWQKGFEAADIDPERYLVPAGPDITPPWHFLSSRTTGEFMNAEREKYSKKALTDNCLYGECSLCGVCQGAVQNRRADEAYTPEDVGMDAEPESGQETHPQSSSAQPAVPITARQPRAARQFKTAQPPITAQQSMAARQPETAQKFPHDGDLKKQAPEENFKVLFCFFKKGVLKYIGHLDLMTVLIRAGRRAGIPFRYSQGFNPRPRFSLPFPLALGIESEYELGEMLIGKHMGVDELIDLYNRELPEELRLFDARVHQQRASVASNEYFHDYEVSLGEGCKSQADEWLTGLVKRDRFDDAPLSFYCTSGKNLHLRLDGKKSIKKAFSGEINSYLAYDIKRVKIWKKQGSSLVLFVENTSE